MSKYITQGKAEVINDRGTLRIEARYIDALQDRLGEDITVELRHKNGYVETTRFVWKSEASFSVLENTLAEIDASAGDFVHYKVKVDDNTNQQELDSVTSANPIKAVRFDSDSEDYHLIADGKTSTACGKTVRNSQEKYAVPDSEMLVPCEHCEMLRDKTLTVGEMKTELADALDIDSLSDGQHFSKVDVIKMYVAVMGKQ